MYILTAYVSSPPPHCKSQKVITLHFGTQNYLHFLYSSSPHLHSTHSFKLQNQLYNSYHDSRPEHRWRKECGYS